MRSIGIRELRHNASTCLRSVEAGETLEVTDRGRPIALIVPIPEDPIERLTREGRLSLPAEDIDILSIEPGEPVLGLPLPSEILRQLREHER